MLDFMICAGFVTEGLTRDGLKRGLSMEDLLDNERGSLGVAQRKRLKLCFEEKESDSVRRLYREKKLFFR